MTIRADTALLIGACHPKVLNRRKPANINMRDDSHRQSELKRLEATTAALRSEIEQRRKIEQMVKHIAANVYSLTGTAFLQKLVEQLAVLFNAEYTFIGKLDRQGSDIVNTLAVWAHGQLASNMTYSLANTPCAIVANGHTCVYRRDVRAQFPYDRLLAEMGVDSYIGTPLFDAEGFVLGLVVVLNGKIF